MSRVLIAFACAAALGQAPAQPDADPARAHYDRGLDFERQQKLDEAAAEYRAALARTPSLAEAHDRLGFVLGAQGHTAEAIAEFEHAVALQPALFDARYHLGATLWWTKQLDRARGELARAVKLRPAHAEARYYLAVTERQQGDVTAAVDDFRTAIRHDPKLVPAHTQLGV